MQEGAAYAELNKPSWDRKLWDDRGSWFKAISLRTVADIGVTIAASMVLPGAGTGIMAILGNAAMTAGVNMLDDVAFGLLDVGTGYKSWDQAAFDVGKKGLSSFAGAAIGGFGKEIMGTMGGVANAAGEITKSTGLYAMKGLDGVVARSLFQLGQQATTSLVTSAINAVSYSSEKGWGYDGDSLRQGVFGGGAMSGYLSSFAGNLTEGLLGQYNLADNNGNWLNSQTYGNLGDVKAMNAFAGSMVSTGLTYGMTGNMNLNVLNFQGTGLMEMHLGNQGFSMNVGTGGTDVSLGTIATAMGGLEHSNKITSFKYGDSAHQKTFDSINGLGYMKDKSMQMIGSRLFRGTLTAKYTDALDADTEGKFNALANANEIQINDAFLKMEGSLGAAKLAALFAHEGSHVLGNTVEAVADIMAYKGMKDLEGAWGVSDQAYDARLLDEVFRMENWQKNTGDDQFAKFVGKAGEWGEVGIRRDNAFEVYLRLAKPVTDVFTGSPKNVANMVTNEGFNDLVYSGRDGHDINDSPEYDPVDGLLSLFLYANGVKEGIKAGKSALRIGVEQAFPFTVMIDGPGLTARSNASELGWASLESTKASIDGGNLFMNLLKETPGILQSIGNLKEMDAAVFDTAERIGLPLQTRNKGYGSNTVEQIQLAAK